MRLLLSSLLVLVLCTCVRAQIGARIDGEYVEWCMVDSLPTGQVVRFTRILSLSTRDVIDVGSDGSIYTAAGVQLTCSAFDLRETVRDPLEDFYAGCQCEYTIGQEDHRVTEIRGGNIQEWEVEYQEVVRRTCSGQATGFVVHRDTLSKTVAFSPTGSRLQFGWTFSAVGQYVDQVNFRYYTSGTTTSTISIDLNPNTVTTTYPGLGLNVADFEYDGSNLAAMAAAYQVVLDNQVTGTTNAITASFVNNTLSIFTELKHEPLFPYVTQPRPGDADYLVTATTTNGAVAIGNPGFGTATVTSNYSEECEIIYTSEYGSYIFYSQDTPLELQPRLDVTTSLQAQNSNETAFCNVSPAICAELTPDPVDLGGCVEICSDVLNVAGQLPVADIDTTLTANTYNSISILVTAGPVGVVLNGQRINYPAGWSTLWSAQDGKLLQNTIRIDATGAEAIITYMK